MRDSIDYNLKYSWRVQLNNGQVYYDEDNSKSGEKASWLKLADLLSSNSNLRINSMQIFRTKDNEGNPENLISVSAPRSNADGYFFLKRASMTMGGPQSQEAGIGFLMGDRVQITWFNMNQMIPTESNIRKKDECGVSLIINNPE